MPLLRHILTLLLVLSVTINAISQSPDYRLETFGTRDGLLSSKIYALAQTNDRSLWIGTELGLSVYNGYSFTNYQYTSGYEPIGRVLCITQDSLHGVWVGGDRGLFYFFKGAIKKISLHSRSSIAIEALLTDGKGNVWAGDINALYKITPANITSFQNGPQTSIELLPYGNFTNRVFGLAVDKQQNIYAAGYDALFKFPAGENKYHEIWHNTEPEFHILSVAATSPDSVFWNSVSRHPSQLLHGEYKQFYSDDFLGRLVFTHHGQPYALTTAGVGLIKNNGVQPLVSIEGISNNAVAALIDAEENIWIGSWEGLLKYRKTSFRQYALQDPEYAETFSMLEKKNGDVLFGSNHGKVFIKKNGLIVPGSIPKLFPQAEVMCMAEAADGSLWFGSGYQGIVRLKNNTLTHFRQDSLLKDENCEMLYPVDGGKYFACTEQGVTVIDPLAANPLRAHYPFEKKYARYPELFGCFQVGNSGYWFYGSQGLYSLRNNRLVDDSIDKMPVKSLYINKIIHDSKGNVWVATQGKGLLKCSIKNGRLELQKQYDRKAGAPSDNALSALADKNDNIWWGDYMSVSVLIYNAGPEQLVSFNEKDGLLSSYYQTLKLEQQRDGTLWGLTTMGLFSFHPDSIGRNELPPVLLLDHITGKEDTSISTSDAQSLSYRHNSLSFHYTAVCLSDPSRIRYAFRLLGLDSNWTYTAERVASFNFLQPGTYTFEVKACNNNNVWTTQPVRFIFEIHPPFWQTLWFRSLVILLIAAIVYLIFRRRIASFKTKAAIKQQMAELEAKAIRAQMNPHFIFNSLNAIQESIVLNDFDTSYQYLSKFSKLLRLVLNNSEKNFIPLQSEIEMNRLYLELESLRFKHSFSYSIEVDEAIDIDMVQFPSLMLQPFIENAIWHGLMHREGEKKLWVRFRLQGQQLVCIIEDNGIGREKANAIKKQKLGSHHFESKGTDLARQRIQLLEESGTMSATLTIEDIKDDKSDSTGTRIIISIPLIDRKKID